MVPSPLQLYVSQLEASGELSRIAVTVEPILEIAAITNKVCKQTDGGKALLFDQPGESDFALATNLFGSTARVCRALGVTDLNELTERMCQLLDAIPALNAETLDRQISDLPEFKRFSASYTCKADPDLVMMDPPDLDRFPFLRSWPGDGAASGHSRYITLPQVFTADPDGGTNNCGIYRVQLRGKQEVAIQWKAGSGAARHAEQYRLAGKPMPVAIVLGGDPATLFSAMFPLPGAVDEVTFAGFLRGAPIATVACRTVSLHIPAGAEVVIEGFVLPGDEVTEGPFGNHTGFYSPAAPAALMQVSAISHRPKAIIPATVVGPPPMEDCWMALAWERLLLAFLQRLEPSVKDIHFPFEWVFHQSAIISLDNPQPGMVRNISDRLWSLPWFRASRMLLFITSAPEKTGLSHAAWKAINVTDFGNDIYKDTLTGRIAVDATGCSLPGEEIATSTELADTVARRWKEYGIA